MFVKDCPRCKGTGFMKVKGGVDLCQCRFSTDTVNVILRIPKRYWNASLDEFIPSTPSQYIALDETKVYCESEAYKEGKGLTYVGPPSVGKTYLAVSLIKKIYVDKRIKSIFFDTRDLLFILRGLMENGRDKNLIRFLIDIPILLLDGLGNERLSDWQREILSYIIVQRYNYVKPIIITTNYPLENEGDGLNSLEERLGEEVISKLKEINTTVRMSK